MVDWFNKWKVRAQRGMQRLILLEKWGLIFLILEKLTLMLKSNGLSGWIVCQCVFLVVKRHNSLSYLNLFIVVRTPMSCVRFGPPWISAKVTGTEHRIFVDMIVSHGKKHANSFWRSSSTHRKDLHAAQLRSCMPILSLSAHKHGSVLREVKLRFRTRVAVWMIHSGVVPTCNLHYLMSELPNGWTNVNLLADRKDGCSQ